MQNLAPINWDIGRFGPFEAPLNVLLIPKLPSAHKSAVNYSVCILYRYVQEFLSWSIHQNILIYMIFHLQMLFIIPKPSPILESQKMLSTMDILAYWHLVFRPANLPSAQLGQHSWLRYPGPAGYLRFICCGPSQDRGCPVGARTSGPCAHGVSALFADCVLAQNPVRSKYYLFCL